MSTNSTLSALNISSVNHQQQATGIEVVRGMMHKYASEIEKALPNNIKIQKYIRIVDTALSLNPKLSDADPKSFLGAVIQCAQLGLEPNNSFGHIFLIPYYNKSMAKTEVQVQIGYRGMIELGYRSGYLNSISSSEVYEDDKFEISLGTNPSIDHTPKLQPESTKGSITFFYAVADTKGGKQFAYMSHEKICKIRDGGRFQNPIWSKHFIEMGKKTVIRRLFKLMPMSTGLMERAMKIDNQINDGIPQRNEELFPQKSVVESIQNENENAT